MGLLLVGRQCSFPPEYTGETREDTRESDRGGTGVSLPLSLSNPNDRSIRRVPTGFEEAVLQVAVLVPVLNRPERVKPFVESFWCSLTSSSLVNPELVFICSASDDATYREMEDAEVEIIVVRDYDHGDYAKKINLGMRLTPQYWVFTGADDLEFHIGWDTAFVQCTQENPDALVIGTQDMGNGAVIRGDHSTHNFVHHKYATDYGTADEKGKVFHEGYHHNFCDTELVETAKVRGVYAFADDCRIEHMHYMWGKSVQDETYVRGQSQAREDSLVFHERSKLWRQP